jgi:hypothetical protein
VLTKALAAVTALQLGVDPANPVAPALSRFYEAARHTLLGSALVFDAAALAALGRDFREVGRATCGTDIAP